MQLNLGFYDMQTGIKFPVRAKYIVVNPFLIDEKPLIYQRFFGYSQMPEKILSSLDINSLDFLRHGEGLNPLANNQVNDAYQGFG